MKHWIGCSGWQYGEWLNKFYPQDLSKAQFFDYYKDIFNTVEINYTFYHFPSEQTLKRWYTQAPNHFKYTLKASRFITHIKRFKEAKEAINRLYIAADILAEKLGFLLFQLPGNIHYDKSLLLNIIDQLDASKKNVIEFRHSSWWNEEVYGLLKKAGLNFCTVRAPNLPNELIAINGIAYARFHGKHEWFKDNFPTRDLTAFAQEASQKKLTELWVYFNNDVGAYAPKNAQKLLQIMHDLEKIR